MHFRAIAVDDDPKALSLSLSELKKSGFVSEALGFTSSKEALSYVSSHFVPVVLLDIRMPEIDGLLLAEKILDINPRTNIIFVTTYSHYLPHAFSLHASGYIMKPIDGSKLVKEVNNLRFPLEEEKMGFYAKTFGPFHLSYDGQEVVFKSELEKEVMAYLVDHNGLPASLEKISQDLERSGEEIENAIKSLQASFDELGEDGVLFKSRKGYFLDMAMVPSDFSEAMEGVMEAKYLFAGEYLSPYKWARDRQKELMTIL